METTDIYSNIINNNLSSNQVTSSESLKNKISQNFESVLTNLLFSATQQTGTSLFQDTSSTSILSLSLIALIEQFLSAQSSQDWVNMDSKAIQINQFDAETLVGGDGSNANCGPTSLAMSLHALGLNVKGETTGMNDGEVIDLARLCMIYDPARDGVDSLGHRMESEHNTYTNLTDVIHGAQISGANAASISTDTSSIQNALQNNSVVVVSGTFSGKLPPPWTGDRGKDNLSAPGNATAHIVAVTGYNPETQKFTVNDPARNTPVEVYADELQYFMAGNAGAVAISR